MAGVSDDEVARLHLEAVMRRLGEDINAVINEGAPARKPRNGFVLLTFPFGEVQGRATNYISNAEHETMLFALLEVLARFEGLGDTPPGQA